LSAKRVNAALPFTSVHPFAVYLNASAAPYGCASAFTRSTQRKESPLTDPDPDTWRLVRAVSVQTMSRHQKGDYLREHGWICLHHRKQQRWVSRNGVRATLAGAIELQLLQDFDAP
jgi:hypothetical protein